MLDNLIAHVRLLASTAIVGLVRLVTASGDEVTDDVVDAVKVTGETAHDAVDAGQPIKVGGKAESTVPTDVQDADRTDAWFDLKGRLTTAERDALGNIAALTDQDTGAGVDNARDVAIMIPAAGGGTQLGLIDHAPFVTGTAAVMPVGFEFDDVSPNAIDEGDIGAARMGADRVLYAQGQIAHDAVDSGNPIKTGGKAESTAPVAVADADRVDGWYDTQGRHIVAEADGSGNQAALTDQDTGAGVDPARDIAIMVPANGGGAQLGLIDDAAFTPGTSAVMPMGAEFDDAATDSVDEGDVGIPRMSADRVLYAQGAIAHDSVDSGNPIKTGGKAETTAPAAVADADRVNGWYDEYGRHIVTEKDNSGNVVGLTDQDTGGTTDLARDVAIMVPANGGGTQLGLIDDAVFTPGTSAVMPLGALVDDTAPDSVDEGDIGAPRMSADRVLYVQGAVAHDAVDSGNPVKIGGKAETIAPAAVQDGDRVDAWLDEYGRQVVALKDTSGNVAALTEQDTGAGVDMAQDVALMVPAAGGGKQIGVIDDAAFTPGTDAVLPLAAEYDDAAPDSVDEGDAGALRMSARRELYTQIRDAAGNERGVNVNAQNEAGVCLDGNKADLDSDAGTDNHAVVAVGLPASGGHVVGGTTTNPFNTKLPATWYVTGASGLNAALTLTKAAAVGQRHYITGFTVSVWGAPAAQEIEAALNDGVIKAFSAIIGEGASTGERLTEQFSHPVEMAVNTAVTLVIDAGGAGVGTIANLLGYTL